MTDLPEYRREESGAQPPALHPAYASTVKRAPLHPPIRLPHTLSEITKLCLCRSSELADNHGDKFFKRKRIIEDHRMFEQCTAQM